MTECQSHPAAQQLLSDESLSHIVDHDRVIPTRDEITAKWDSILDIAVLVRAARTTIQVENIYYYGRVASARHVIAVEMITDGRLPRHNIHEILRWRGIIGPNFYIVNGSQANHNASDESYSHVVDLNCVILTGDEIVAYFVENGDIMRGVSIGRAVRITCHPENIYL